MKQFRFLISRRDQLFETNNMSAITLEKKRESSREEDWSFRQNCILERCHKSKSDLDLTLSEIGKKRDDLCYEINCKQNINAAAAPALEDFKEKPNGVPMISFFSGCGGLDLGFETAGFNHLALVEHNKLFCETIRLNRPNWRVIGPPREEGDVSKREDLLNILKNKCNIKSPFEGVLVGGPPCQPFSIASNQRFNKNGINFKRVGFEHEKNGNLLFDMLFYISELRPLAFLIENVEGLYDVDNGEQLEKALTSLSSWGYVVAKPFVLDAANYQVPQHRRRLFICGSRTGRDFLKPKPAFNFISCEAALRPSLCAVENHEPRQHKPGSILRYMTLGYGQRDHLGRVDRLDPTLPSKTVIAGGTKGGGRSHLHPHIPRTLTARECARLQTFPDDYVFLGPSARQFTQIGNAVPPILAAQLAKSIYKSFFQ